jgi:hypothetical protein
MIHHYRRLERVVLLGGVRIGPLPLVFAGRYRVRPMTAFQWSDWVRAMASMQRLGAPDRQEDLGAWLTLLPLEALKPLVHLIVDGPVDPRHLARATADQVAKVFAAFAQVNDLSLIYEVMLPKNQGMSKPGPKWTLEDIIDGIARVRPSYTHEELCRLPIQQLCAVIQTIERRAEEASPEGQGPRPPQGSQPLSQEEQAALAARFQRAAGK